MINSKNRELAISATSKIFEKVNDALRKRDSDKRWFWELLQNAKDTVVYKKGEVTNFNTPDKKVDIKIVVAKNENDETVLRFIHNGNPFQSSNHPYKYDDPKCLLLADSGKIEEDEEKREDVTGQFGTGFLSTHVLSLRILVEGIFLDKNFLFNDFKFELDRRFQNKLELAEKVEKSLDQYDDNFTQITAIDNLETIFTYFLDDNKAGLQEGLNIVNIGIECLEEYIPYVLAFSKEIRSVAVIDEISNMQISFERSKDLIKIENKEEIIVIEKNSSKLKEPEIISVLLTSDLQNHIDLALRIYAIGNQFELRKINRSIATLFCTFPLIGSEEWRFPMVFNSSKFYPETERNGITLIKDKDNGNRLRVKQAISLYKSFVTSCIKNNYQNLIYLADTKFLHCPDWCDKDWYVEQLNEIRTFLMDQYIVKNELGIEVKLSETVFPISQGSEKLKSFWNICYKYLPGFIPQFKDSAMWNELIDVDFEVWDSLKFPLERLLQEIHDYRSLSSLAKNKFSGNIDNTIEWLNSLYSFIINENNQKDVFDSFAIIPNQLGEFKRMDDLRFDVNIPEELKDVLYMFMQDKRDILINKSMIIFKDHKPLSVEDVSHIINKHINDKSKEETSDYKKAMFMMCAYFTSDLSERRNGIYEFSIEFFPEFTPANRKVLANTADFNWENVNRWILKSIVGKLESLTNVEMLQNYFIHQNYDRTILWLDKFLNFLHNSKNDYKDFLDENAITPNQNDAFCLINILFNDADLIDEKLKIILYNLTNKREDWKEILLRDGISLELNKSKTIKEIAGLIDDYVKDNRDNTSSHTIRDSILALIKWVSNQEDDQTEDLFKWFYLNKANLLLSTLDSSNDRDNIFDIIQSGQSLNTLARIAKSSLTDAQLNALLDSTELVGQFISWLNDKQADYPDEELGEIGEEFLFFHLCKVLGEENVEWSKMKEYDFTVYNSDKSIRFYIDAKTTARGISNSENVPFYMRTSQWNFLPKEEVKNKYLIARVFKNSDTFDVRFLNIKPEMIS